MARVADAPIRRLGLRLVPTYKPGWLGFQIGIEFTIDGRSLLELVRDEESRFKSPLAGAYSTPTLEIQGLVGADDWTAPPVYAGVEALVDRPGTTLLACSCGDPYCWGLFADIEADGEIVRWTRFRSTLSERLGRGYPGLDPLVFALKPYLRAFARLEPAIRSAIKKRLQRLADDRHAQSMQRLHRRAGWV